MANVRCACGYIRGESAGVRVCDNCDRVQPRQTEGLEREVTEYDKQYQERMRTLELEWYGGRRGHP